MAFVQVAIIIMDGRSHSTISALAAPVASILALRYSQDIGFAFYVGVGCGLVGQVLTPDLDVDDVTFGEWEIVHKLGPLGGIGFLWMAYWWDYAWAIPHRSIASHAPIIGTVFRIIYLLWWVPILFVVKGWTWPAIDWQIPAGLFCGLCVSDALHWLADFVPLRYTKRRRRRQEYDMVKACPATPR
jgi:uncharacterized metal-binding protein